MRLLSWDYGVRNLTRRPLRTVLTALGLALVVFLVMLVLGFQRGLDESLAQSGDPQVFLLHHNTAAENLENSAVGDDVPALVKAELRQLLAENGGVPAVSPELILATLVQAGEGPSQIGLLRGVQPEVFLVRTKAYLTQGAWPQSGRETKEVLVGRLAAAKLGLRSADVAVGRSLLVDGKPWKIVGHFAAPGTVLESEIWCPLDDLKALRRRTATISLVALRIHARTAAADAQDQLDNFCRRYLLKELMATRELVYYGSLQKHYQPIRLLAWLLVMLVLTAGCAGAINTMYAAVAGRVREFAALQAVGFPRHAILVSLLQESLLLASSATLAAAGLALLLLRGTAVRFTMGAFHLQLDGPVLLAGCIAGVALGILGCIPPAWRAFRLEVADGLKAV